MSKKAHETALPKLRFPEFRDAEAWEIPPLGELMDGVSRRNRDNKISRVFTNSAVSGIIDQRDFFDKDIATAGNTDNYTVIELGDYVYNPRISEFAPVGPTSRNKLGQGIVSPLYTVFRFRNSNHNEFYDYYFGSTHWQNSLKAIGNSGARHDRMGISLTQLRLVKVPYPSLAEQQKIAATLSSLDTLLTAQTGKLTALQAHKRGLMQDLFPAEGEVVPKRRFPEFRDAGEWQKTSLASHIDLLSGYAFQSAYFAAIGKKLITPKNFTKTGYASFSSDNTKYTTEPCDSKYICKKGDLLLLLTDLTPSCELLGKPVLLTKNDGEVLLNQRIVKVIPRASVEIHFLLQFFSTETYHKRIRETASGSTVRHSSNKIIASTKLYLPSKEEQQKIANCLSALDNIITAQTQKIAALKLHKKGLMQALFPVVSEPAA